MILYLHGFRSSPASIKARLLSERMRSLGREAEYRCPQLPASPQEAIQRAMEEMQHFEPANVALIGSSLGGYYATWLAEQTGCRAVLLNPAVKPPRDLERYVGVTTAYHDDSPFEFKKAYIEELQNLSVIRTSLPHRYYLIAATGDEVLDWREMVAHYPDAQQTIIDGSDHGISEFADHIDNVLAFCGVKVDQAQR